ncbi:putative nucleotide-diphospho-sugar transferase [Luteolibacter luteus]|uniref:putative nucleotide-diphospho-sugar transferase n=1 Tax=Luteolibacter luteus TaxID=2728835 RepID=UPI001F0F7797|nr:putative nucleotide-diphospho-sugar transferase [Luteolibacter luteus]
MPYTWIPSWSGKESRQAKTRLFEYTPFDLTLFVDTDTVFGEAIDMEELLGDADLAMGLDADPQLGRGARVFLKYPGFTSAAEVDETLNLCGETFPFFNSGVMVWRQTEKTRAFFERWHLEWCKYRRADQLALARALCSTNIRVKALDKRFNFPVLSKDLVYDKAIYHLIFKERIAKEVGLWRPEFDGLMDAALSKILSNGVRAENHYLHIGQTIYNDPGSSTLVVCPAGDEAFWSYCADGNCVFVTEGGGSAGGDGNESHQYDFKSKVGEWLSTVEVPAGIDRSFDYVIISGPKGFNSDCPGREIPVAWASKLAKKGVFVFDYNRQWERQVCDRYLGAPHYVVPPVGRGDAELAVFHRGN